MREINPGHIDALIGMVNNGPYYQLLSMRIVEIRRSYARVEINMEHKHMNPFGIIHGGVISSVLDTAGFWAAYCDLDEDVGFTSMDLNVTFLSMVLEGLVIVEGKAIKVGRSSCLVEAKASDPHGKLLAHATSKIMLLQGRQNLDHVVEVMGYPALPPKFLD